MKSGVSRFMTNVRHSLSCPVLTVLMASLLLPFPNPIHAHTAELQTAAATGEGQPAVLDEHLGARIPQGIILRDESGKLVRLEELLNVPAIILPVYYSCTNVCVYLQARIAGTVQNIGTRPVRDYRIISFSIDENETPAMASRSKKMYLGAMRTPFPEDGWRFLTGDAANIKRLTTALGFGFQRQGRDFIHPVVSIVVSPDGTIARYLYGTAILPKDLALALVEAKNGIAGISIRKVMEYCFTFDPEAKTYVFNILRVSAAVVILTAGVFLAFLFIGGKKQQQHKPGDP